ncbi:hypothetical protein AHAS_Ahas15G0279900 [Arachis hypogaea]
MVDIVVGMVDMGWGHMEVNDNMRLVSMVVEGYVEEGVHMHMMVVVDNHNKGHHILINMHQDLNYTQKKPEEVVAKKVVHKLGDPPTFDLQIFDAYPHCSFYS